MVIEVNLTRNNKARVYGLDLLRTLAITSVILFHYPTNGLLTAPIRHYGWIGVDLFFVLSGYLIGGQLFSGIVKHEQFSIKLFYARRFLRTLPNYYVMLALYFLIPQIRESTQVPSLWRYLFFTQNFGVPKMFGVTWSLCIEEHFYLFFPILVIILAKLRKPRMVGVLIVLLIVAGVVLRSLIWMDAAPSLNFNNAPEVWGFYIGRVSGPTYNRLDGLALGVGLAAIRCFRPHWWARLMANGNSLLMSGLAGLVVSAIVLIRQVSFISCALGFPLLAISFALITASSVSRKSWLCKLKLPSVHFIAVLSYSLYLTHPIAISGAFWVSRRLTDGISHSVLFPTTVLFCLGLSGLLFCLVERPCLRIRDRLFSTKKDEEIVVAQTGRAALHSLIVAEKP